MINSLSTPQDIVEAIIEIADYDTLLQCALVSQSFLFPSRKMLFSDIVLQNEMQSDRLQRILVQNPYIQSFIKSLTILNKEDGEGPHQWLTGKRSISALLATLHLPLHHMASFSLISSPFPIYWSYLHDTLKSALRNIFCSPSLTKLRISGFQDIPIPFLFHLNHIQDLVLDETCMLIIPIPVHDFPRIPGLGSGAEHVSDAATERFAWKMRHVGFYILGPQFIVSYLQHAFYKYWYSFQRHFPPPIHDICTNYRTSRGHQAKSRNRPPLPYASHTRLQPKVSRDSGVPERQDRAL